MKIKVIFGLLLLLILSSCGNKKAEQRVEEIKKDSLTIPQNIKNVSAIGKIEPEEGLVSISSETGGIVLKVLKDAGARVVKGDVILILKADVETINEAVIKDQIRKQQLLADSDFATIAQFQAQLDEKSKELAVNERLVLTGAETQQNVEIAQKDLKVFAANLLTAQKNSAASQAGVTVLKAQLKEARASTANMTVSAQQDGVIVGMDAKPGAAVVALTSFGSLAPDGKLVVHGEIDEMFSSKVSIGDQVTVTVPGTKDVLATGKITFLSPILQDKSIFYELAGEQSDRRVRSFKVEIDKTDQVLINQKVQCDIKVD